MCVSFACRGLGGAAAEAARDKAFERVEIVKAEAERAHADAAAAAAVVAALEAKESEGGEVQARGAGPAMDVGFGEGQEGSNEKRAELQLCNRAVYHCLGALGVFVVDAGSRAALLQVRVGVMWRLVTRISCLLGSAECLLAVVCSKLSVC